MDIGAVRQLGIAIVKTLDQLIRFITAASAWSCAEPLLYRLSVRYQIRAFCRNRERDAVDAVTPCLLALFQGLDKLLCSKKLTRFAGANRWLRPFPSEPTMSLALQQIRAWWVTPSQKRRADRSDDAPNHHQQRATRARRRAA